MYSSAPNEVLEENPVLCGPNKGRVCLFRMLSILKKIYIYNINIHKYAYIYIYF
jgi:hypothetical protein